VLSNWPIGTQHKGLKTIGHVQNPVKIITTKSVSLVPQHVSLPEPLEHTLAKNVHAVLHGLFYQSVLKYYSQKKHQFQPPLTVEYSPLVTNIID
jgi:hypothetical protein